MAMKDSPFWPFGPEHPDDVPYVMHSCRCAFCREAASPIDSAAVWEWTGFKRTIEAAQGVVIADPATKRPDTYLGFPIIVDETLSPGTVELRSGKEVVRVINLNLN